MCFNALFYFRIIILFTFSKTIFRWVDFFLCRYLWIRLALYEKKLANIINHLVTNATRYYDRDSLVADPDFGSILSSLLVGPCALDYTRAKTVENFWTDPPADELIQRHRISSGNPTPPSCRRMNEIMNFKRSLHSSEDGSTSSFKSGSTASAAKDYVESLHQNSRATLLYGKNNVLVLPVCSIQDKVNKPFILNILYACLACLPASFPPYRVFLFFFFSIL